MNYLIKLNACAGSQSFEVDLTDDELRGVEKVAEMSQCAYGCAPKMSIEQRENRGRV